MRVAIFVLGIASILTGEASKAFDSATGSASAPNAAAANVLTAPTERFTTPNTSAWLDAQDNQGRRGALGAMGFVPSQQPTSLGRTRSLTGTSTQQPRHRYNPANIPLPATRTLEDHLLTGFVALMLIAYQLRRKHRFLRPHQFST